MKNFRACLAFAQIDVADPEQVKAFGCRLMRVGHEDFDINVLLEPWQVHECTWNANAPNHRMACELWRTLSGEEERNPQFWGLEEIACAEILGPIQAKLREVLDGIESVDLTAEQTGQADFGEACYLPRHLVPMVNAQLARVQPRVLCQSSDYLDAVEMQVTYWIKTGGLIPPVRDPDRYYEGVDGRGVVTITGEDGRAELINVETSFLDSPHGLAWGYAGGGPNALAHSLLTDALEGDVKMAEEHKYDFVEAFNLWTKAQENFRISRADVLSWLRGRDVTQASIEQRRLFLERRRAELGPSIERYRRVLKADLVAQIFDLVPQDFEAALYVDLFGMLQWGGRVMKCARCGHIIPQDGSERDNRQRARWKAGRPVYHDTCAKTQRQVRQGQNFQKWAARPENKEHRRVAAKKRRQQTKRKPT